MSNQKFVIKNNIIQSYKYQLNEQIFNHQNYIENDDISNQRQDTLCQSNNQNFNQITIQSKTQKYSDIKQVNQLQDLMLNRYDMDGFNQFEEISNPQQQQYKRQQLQYYDPLVIYQEQKLEQSCPNSQDPFKNYGLQEKKQRINQKLQNLLTPKVQVKQQRQTFQDKQVKKLKTNNYDAKIIQQKDHKFQIKKNKIQTNQIQTTRQQDQVYTFPQKKQKQDISNDSQKLDTKFNLFSNKPQINQPTNPLLDIVVTNKNKIFYHTKVSIGIYENLLSQAFFKFEQGCSSSKIIGFQVNKAGKVIVQTETHVILFNKHLQEIDSFKDKIEKDLITFSQGVFPFDSIIYFSDKKNKLLMREISKPNHKFDRLFILLETDKPISIKIIQNSNLFLGFQNGLIKQYSLNSYKITNQYVIKQENSNQMKFSSIIFGETYCLGIIQNRILKLNYLSKKTKNFLNATQNIIQCCYYYNSEEQLYVIHALLENNKIYKSIRKNGKQIQGKVRQLKELITSITFSDKNMCFIYGCQNGNIHTYKIRQM